MVQPGYGPIRCGRFGVKNARVVKQSWRKRDPTWQKAKKLAKKIWPRPTRIVTRWYRDLPRKNSETTLLLSSEYAPAPAGPAGRGRARSESLPLTRSDSNPRVCSLPLKYPNNRPQSRTPTPMSELLAWAHLLGWGQG